MFSPMAGAMSRRPTGIPLPKEFPMAPASPAQIAYLTEFLQERHRDVKLDDVMELAQRMADTLDEQVAHADALLYEDFRAIADEISGLKREMSSLRPDHMRFERIPEAGRELDAVVESTEEASGAIMTAAEEIMAADASDPEAYKAMVDERMIIIFEACAFQDLTGQRIRKVIKTLTWIDERIGQLATRLKLTGGDEAPQEDEDERRMRELILHGPQMKGEGVSQDAVDDFFSKSDQDDIDKLFD
jgi:chemotaxis protein CheZ